MSFPICKFFRSEQGCKFGNKCRYRHSDSFSPPTPLSNHHFQDEPVRGYASGSPAESFPFYSSVSHPQYELPVSGGQRRGRFQDPEFERFTSRNHGEPVKASSLSEEQLSDRFYQLQTKENHEGSLSGLEQKPGGKICHFYANNGYCCFGSRCRFVHIPPNVPQSRFQRFDTSHDSSEFGHRPTHSYSGSQNRRYAQEGKGVRNPSGDVKSYSSYPARRRYDGPSQQAASSARGPGGAEGRQPIRADPHLGTDKRADSGKPPLHQKKVCHFYLNGWCVKGRRCKFLHPRNSAQEKDAAECSTQGEETGEESKTSHKDSEPPPPSLDGAVNKTTGEHAQEEPAEQSRKETNPQNASENPSKEKLGAVKKGSGSARPPYIAHGSKKYRREEVDDVEASRLRRSDIDFLVKRFPKSWIKVSRDCAEYFQCVVTFSPTDPDWPFDVKEFQLELHLPADYPHEMLSVSLPPEQDLPETVRRYVEACVEEWVDNKERQLEESGHVQLLCRPFLHWLDRSLEDIVTQGLSQLKREIVAKASGLEFVSAKQLQKQYPGQTSTQHHDDQQDNSDGDNDDDETSSGSADDEDSSSDDYDIDEEAEDNDGDDNDDRRRSKTGRKARQDQVKAMLTEPARKGTEISMKNLQLKEGAATVYLEKICLSLQCERCRGTTEFTTSGGRVNVVQCGQCGQTQMATFRPAIMHHFSSVVGYLDLDACAPFDVNLQNCGMVITCSSCAKDSRPGAWMPGQPQDHWCRVCHHKLRVATDGVRFTQLEPSRVIQSIKGAVKVVVPTRTRIPKDPAIVEGKPLPNFGTCKHYKKSYRWLRFPCCGKCYPCDVCHDSKEDHEMKYANRMICGFCCKEQVYAADRPCKGCDMNMTKVHTPHWEGGQGCRDKITMSRNDKHKHKNQSKTVSKHAQKVKEMQSKKKTKLRHA